MINLALQKDYVIERTDERAAEAAASAVVTTIGPFEVDQTILVEDHDNRDTKLQNGYQDGDLRLSGGTEVLGTQNSINPGETFVDKLKNDSIILLGEESLDDIQRLKNANLMIENIILTLRNISTDHNLHNELINNGLVEAI